MERIDVGSLCVALIGYGEVGAILGRALVERGVARVAAYDIVIDDPLRGRAMRAAAERDGVTLATTNAEAIGGASLILCAVTASSALDAARESARAVAARALFVDLNSASPRTKRECAGAIDTGGGLYVEAAVMTSVPPYGIRVPMLLGGPHAAQAQPLLATLGFRADIASPETGVASAIKMCRSVVIKGMEALFVESLLCARAHGVEHAVLDSLAETFPGIDWDRQASYFWSRVAKHGRRRAEEMRECASMVADDGFAPSMAERSADRQAFIAELAARGVFAGVEPNADWRALADRVLERRRGGPHAVTA